MTYFIYGAIGFCVYKFFSSKSRTSAADVPSPGVTQGEVPQMRQSGRNTNDNADETDMAFTESEAETAAEKAKGAKYLP